jgi:ActR/RegA family two-component response regulator
MLVSTSSTTQFQTSPPTSALNSSEQDSDSQARRTSQIENLNLDKVVLQHIHYVLDLNHGNKLRTARHLGISRSTLYRILEGSRL